MAILICISNVSRGFSTNLLRNSAYNVLGRSVVTLAHHEGRRSNPSSINLVTRVKSHQVIPTCSCPQLQIIRSTSFFNKTTAEQLWKGVTSVSNAGRKRGRGKGVGKKMSKNLNRGQIIGVGYENMQWPGLNTPVFRGRELVQQQKLPKDEEREAKLLKMRDTMGVFRPLRLDPLERGWCGTKLPGRSIGPPDPIGEETFEGFDTKVLEFKTVTHMTGIFGRQRTMSMFVVTGNGNGLGGFALAKSTTVPGTIKQAKNKAAQRLMYFERYNDHTIMHDFFSQFGSTKIFVRKKPEGHGLICHRCIRTICEVIGIKDLHAKVEGSTKNTQNLTKAFFLGLMRQKTHQELADEKQLHLVEFRKENLDFPKVVASPSSGEVRSIDMISRDEEMNFDLYVMGGKMELQRKKHEPFYTNLYGWELYKKKLAKYRNHEKVRQELLIEYGEIRSHLADEHPECKAGPGPDYVGKVSDDA